MSTTSCLSSPHPRLHTESRECPRIPALHIRLILKSLFLKISQKSQVLYNPPSDSRQLLHLPDRSPVL
jgi:hypothetical protein